MGKGKEGLQRSWHHLQNSFLDFCFVSPRSSSSSRLFGTVVDVFFSFFGTRLSSDLSFSFFLFLAKKPKQKMDILFRAWCEIVSVFFQMTTSKPSSPKKTQKQSKIGSFSFDDKAFIYVRMTPMATRQQLQTNLLS
jgi:hypothetical protein